MLGFLGSCSLPSREPISLYVATLPSGDTVEQFGSLRLVDDVSGISRPHTNHRTLPQDPSSLATISTQRTTKRFTGSRILIPQQTTASQPLATDVLGPLTSHNLTHCKSEWHGSGHAGSTACSVRPKRQKRAPIGFGAPGGLLAAISLLEVIPAGKKAQVRVSLLAVELPTSDFFLLWTSPSTASRTRYFNHKQ